MLEIFKNDTKLTDGDQERAKRNDRRVGKVVKTLAALSLVGSAVGVNAMVNKDDGKSPSPEKREPQSEIFYADQNTDEFTVKRGQGVDDVVQEVYGVDAPEGTQQVVQNNPEYEAQYAAIVEQNGGSEELKVGDTFNLPVDFYTQEEVDQMNGQQ